MSLDSGAVLIPSAHADGTDLAILYRVRPQRPQNLVPAA